jgi:chemotaxis protein histidine kinase CheA
MNQETNSEAQDNRQERSTSSKRGSRAGRNRPVLVTPDADSEVTQDQPAEEISDATQPVAEVATTTTDEAPRPRRLPKFFSSVARNEQQQAITANPEAARIARATRSANSRPAKESKAEESSAPAQTSANQAPAKAAPATSSRPRPASAFKMRYLFGILLYLILAELIGGFERSLLIANKLDKLLFQIGPVAVTTSTLAFLVTLIVILVILARLDLVPRSLAALSGQPTPQRRPGQSQNTSNSTGVKTPPPVMKQGVKGEDDDLYQEYREQQRYLQRRERRKR